MANEEPCLAKASKQASQAGSGTDCRAEPRRGTSSSINASRAQMPDCGKDTEQVLRMQEEREQLGVLSPVSWKQLVPPTWSLHKSSQHPGLVSLR